MQAHRDQQVARQETAKLRRAKRLKEKGDLLEKKRKAAAEDKSAHESNRLAAIKTLELRTAEVQMAETVLVSLWGIIFESCGWRGEGIYTYFHINPHVWAVTQPLGIIHSSFNQGGWATTELQMISATSGSRQN